MIDKLFLIMQSLRLDTRVVAAARLPLVWRLRFIVRKYLAILTIARGRPAVFAVGPLRVTVSSLSSLGTLQSSIVDFHDDILATNIIERSDPLILDLGANVGQFCNAAKLFFPDARVLSFEPDPEVFNELERNTAHLTGVQRFNIGLGDRAETRPFHRHALSVMSSFSKGVTDDRYNAEPLSLQLSRLDDVIEPHLQPDLLKIDVEGFERQAILGAPSVLRRSRWLILELSLARDGSEAPSNVHVLRDIVDIVPEARIIKFGRALGFPSQPLAQDVLIRLHSQELAHLTERKVPHHAHA